MAVRSGRTVRADSQATPVIRHALAKLARNLRAGLRIALFLPVSRLDFRIGVAEFIVLLFFSAAFDVGIDFVRHGVDARFSWLGVAGETYAAGTVLLVSASLALLFRQQALALGIPLILFASYPAIQVLHLVPALLERWLPGAGLFSGWLDDVLLLWTIAIFARAVAVALVPVRPMHWLRALAGALALLAPLWFGATFAPDVPWWRSEGGHSGADSRYPNPASEPVMEAQKLLLEEALGGLQDARPGIADLYAIGFAASGDDALRQDVTRALRVLDERWATDGRSVALINHPAALLEAPLASVSNLRAALDEIRAAIDPDEDVVLLYIAGNGAPGGVVEVALPPLDLVPLSPLRVRRMLDEAGIRWRIVIVSSCYSGRWREALADESSLVMTATDDDHAGEGCALDADGTAFGEALFNHGMVDADTLTGAFDVARQRVAARAGGIAGQAGEPHTPQIVVGPAMVEKLREVERGRAARRASRSV
jgi:hypothetical protein